MEELLGEKSLFPSSNQKENWKIRFHWKNIFCFTWQSFCKFSNTSAKKCLHSFFSDLRHFFEELLSSLTSFQLKLFHGSMRIKFQPSSKVLFWDWGQFLIWKVEKSYSNAFFVKVFACFWDFLDLSHDQLKYLRGTFFWWIEMENLMHALKA